MLELIIIAACGGFSIKLLELAELANVPKAQRPDFRDVVFWIPFVAWPLFGAGLAYLYASSLNVSLTPLLSANIGCSAPLIVKTLGKTVSPILQKPIDPGPGA